jgi:hypothetical protein
MLPAFFVDLRDGGAVSANRTIHLTPEVETQGRSDLEGHGLDQRAHACPGQEMDQTDGQAFSMCQARERLPVTGQGQGPEEIKVEATRCDRFPYVLQLPTIWGAALQKLE